MRPGGLFHGVGSQPNLRFRVLHTGDTMVVVDPSTLPARLTAVGFDDDPEVRVADGRLRFTARKSCRAQRERRPRTSSVASCS